MRGHDIVGLRLRRKEQTTVADPVATPALGPLGRDFTAVHLHERRVGNIVLRGLDPTTLRTKAQAEPSEIVPPTHAIG